MEEKRREHGNDNGRRQGDKTEESRHPRVKTCTGRPAAALDQELYQLRSDQRAEREQ